MKLRKELIIISATAGLFAFTSCQDNERQRDTDNIDLGNYDDTEMTEDGEVNQDGMEWETGDDITSRIEDEEELSTFSQGMSSAELSDDFREEEGPFTIFAPSNVAYDELSQDERDQFQNAQHMDRNIASMHYLVIEDELTSDELRQEIEEANGNYTLTTMQGEQISASLNENNEIVLRDGSGNTATIRETDLDASNGTVHVVDRMLRPQDDSRNEAANRNNDMNNMDPGNAGADTNTTGNNNDGDRNRTNSGNNK